MSVPVCVCGDYVSSSLSCLGSGLLLGLLLVCRFWLLVLLRFVGVFRYVCLVVSSLWV